MTNFEGSFIFMVAIDYILIFLTAHVCLLRRRTKHKSTTCLTENGKKKIERGEIKRKICTCISISINAGVILNINKYPAKTRNSFALPALSHVPICYVSSEKPNFSMTNSSNKK
jgi:hypothetical protein